MQLQCSGELTRHFDERFGLAQVVLGPAGVVAEVSPLRPVNVELVADAKLLHQAVLVLGQQHRLTVPPDLLREAITDVHRVRHKNVLDGNNIKGSPVGMKEGLTDRQVEAVVGHVLTDAPVSP